MSEETTSSEPATGPVVATPAPYVHQEPRRSRLTAVAAWVGIVAGVVFVVAVIFFSGFILGKSTGGNHWGGHHRGPNGDVAIFHRGGPPPMFPMGPRGEFERPPFGPGGPGFQPGQPGEPPATSAPSRP